MALEMSMTYMYIYSLLCISSNKASRDGDVVTIDGLSDNEMTIHYYIADMIAMYRSINDMLTMHRSIDDMLTDRLCVDY